MFQIKIINVFLNRAVVPLCCLVRYKFPYSCKKLTVYIYIHISTEHGLWT